jgi:hypothetical protein
MKINKQHTSIESELNIKAVASLRKEIISELTKPDCSLKLLLESENHNENSEESNDGDGEAKP